MLSLSNFILYQSQMFFTFIFLKNNNLTEIYINHFNKITLFNKYVEDFVPTIIVEILV